jgi:thymidylate synthase ThyX
MSEDPMKMAHDMQQRIEKLAYQMWEAAGRQVDKTMDYWLEAEREIRATMTAATKRMMPSAGKKPEEKAAAPSAKAPAKKSAAPAGEKKSPKKPAAPKGGSAKK